MESTGAKEFFLASSEGYNLAEPRKCRPIRRLRTHQRDDLLLVEISPPLLGQPFGLGIAEIGYLVLATRHRGASLFPIVEWPVFVHVARTLIEDPASRESIEASELEEIAWAELYETAERAREKKLR